MDELSELLRDWFFCAYWLQYQTNPAKNVVEREKLARHNLAIYIESRIANAGAKTL